MAKTKQPRGVNNPADSSAPLVSAEIVNASAVRLDIALTADDLAKSAVYRVRQEVQARKKVACAALNDLTAQYNSAVRDLSNRVQELMVPVLRQKTAAICATLRDFTGKEWQDDGDPDISIDLDGGTLKATSTVKVSGSYYGTTISGKEEQYPIPEQLRSLLAEVQALGKQREALVAACRELDSALAEAVHRGDQLRAELVRTYLANGGVAKHDSLSQIVDSVVDNTLKALPAPEAK